MNKLAKLMLAAGLVLSLGACSSSESKTATADDKTAETAKTFEASAGELKTALKNEGYTLADETEESKKISFTAQNDTGTIVVTLVKQADAAAASQAYNDNMATDQDEQFFSLENNTAKTEDGGLVDMTVLNNTMNELYAIEAVNSESLTTYSITGIDQANLDSVKSAMEQAGFGK